MSRAWLDTACAPVLPADADRCQEERARSAQADGEEDLEVADSGWSEVRKTRYINYVTVTLTHILIFLVLGTRGYTIVRDTLNDG